MSRELLLSETTDQNHIYILDATIADELFAIA